jgi:hypothetical protein
MDKLRQTEAEAWLRLAILKERESVSMDYDKHI